MQATKKMIFVSTGRSGTTRLAQILKAHLPDDKFTVVHQVAQSRVCNILGNLMYHFGDSQWLKRKLWNWVISNNNHSPFFITTDPLVSMIIPGNEIESTNICIVHIKRNDEDFARSMFQFTRKRRKSFIAHNFFPFWQPYLWPLENYLSSSILEKYKKVSAVKETFFKKNYALNPNYCMVSMDAVFNSNEVEKLVNKHFDMKVNIPRDELKIVANQSINT